MGVQMCEQIPGQMTIYDWLGLQPEYPDINDVSEEEAVRMVGEAIGRTFAYNSKFREWQAKKGKLKMTMSYDNFIFGNHDRFLGTGWVYGTSSGGSPTSGIKEAIAYFKDVIGRVKEGV